MTASRLVVFVMCLTVVGLWLPSGSGAVPTSQLCQGLGNDLWKQWGDGTLPRNEATIDKLLKVKNDCPQLSGSMDRMANDIKAQREKVAEAVAIVKMAVEKLTQQPAITGQEGNQ